MKLVLAASGIALGLLGRAPAKPSSSARSSVPLARTGPRTAPRLPMLPSVARVRVEVAHDRVILQEEVNLPRGDWRYGGLDLYAAFGAPGPPLAVEARLVALPAGAAEEPSDDLGEPAIVERALRCAPAVQPLLGRAQMAGLVVHLKEAQLRRAFTSSEHAVLRIRSLLRPPAPDSRNVQDLVVRLGVPGGLPMTLGRVQVVSLDGQRIEAAAAELCGPDADPWPLSVSILPKPPLRLPMPSVTAPTVPFGTVPFGAGAPNDKPGTAPNDKPGAAPNDKPGAAIAPEMAVRHATDDLCISWLGPR